ncbi:hypothetical protein SASPL_129337 [Salvia splendens]|uniref:Amine oxidase domain-containing protein n=1 Tax=Salvia splendens TaxID=180675 RepID=A0A8X8XEA4_SALSN|nr:hypothetical protein SASPL_129337 [Salvia splendens]
MDGALGDPVTAAEGGHLLPPAFVDPISRLFSNLMDFILGKSDQCLVNGGGGDLSVGSFLRRGLASFLEKEKKGTSVGRWSKRSLQQAVFAMHESIQRTYTSADDLSGLDYNAEKDYVLFPGEEITVAGGYSGIVNHLASVLPDEVIQLDRKVKKIEWAPSAASCESGRPVALHFSDGTAMSADHIIVTVSLGVLKAGTTSSGEGWNLFHPSLPSCKAGAISRLGYGLVNKVFLRLSPNYRGDDGFPFLQMVFHPSDSELRNPKVPQWIRRTWFLCPIYSNSRTVLSWFTGQEALELEKLTDDEIIGGFWRTVSNLLPSQQQNEISQKFDKVLRTQWGTAAEIRRRGFSYAAAANPFRRRSNA